MKYHLYRKVQIYLSDMCACDNRLVTQLVTFYNPAHLNNEHKQIMTSVKLFPLKTTEIT